MEASNKECRLCKATKSLEEFRLCPDKNGKKYPCAWCRDCEKVKCRERYHANKERYNVKAREWKANNQDKIKETRRVYVETNRDYIKERYKRYCDANREKINKIARDYIRDNPNMAVRKRLCNRLQEALSKSKSTPEYLGTSMSVVRKWLEFNFGDEFTWQNRAEWHIDHTLPINAFDLTDDADIALCCNWMNLMPLRKEHNIRKSDKLQPWRVLHQERQLRMFAVHNPELSTEITDYLQGYAFKYKDMLKQYMCNTVKLREVP
jgi:hypothetical protein